MSVMTGAELTIRLLERQGIKYLAGIPGGTNLPLYDALSQSKIIRHILARHEQAAGFIAQGMARSSGRVAVFFATSGPGATNALTAIADAKLDSIPIVCITGQVASSMIGTDAFQEVDVYGMSIPVTKHNFLVRSVEELLTVIPLAFQIAASGRPGPVLVDIPKDVQSATIDISELPEPGLPLPPEQPEQKLIEKAAKLINAAERPIFYFGAGCNTPKCAALAKDIVETQAIPAVMSLLGLGTIPVDAPLSLGMLGMHGTRRTNMLLEECDLLVVVGARLDDRATGRLDRFCSRAGVIHIDADASEISKLRAAGVGITADATLALEALAPCLIRQERAEWHKRISGTLDLCPSKTRSAQDPRTPYGLIMCSASQVDDTAIITTDVGQHQMRVAQVYPLRRPFQWLTSGGLGTMGFGLPAAIGASLQNPDATVLCYTGDGSFLMNIHELATLAENGNNVKILLSNNDALGLVVQQQDLFYGGRVFGSRYTTKTNYQRIAEGFGISAINLSFSKNPMADLKKAIQAKGPYLIEINIQAMDKVFPMVPPGAANTDMIEGE